MGDRPTSFDDLPDDVVLRIFGRLHHYSTLTASRLARLHDTVTLSCSCSRLHRLFTNSISALDVPSSSAVHPNDDAYVRWVLRHATMLTSVTLRTDRVNHRERDVPDISSVQVTHLDLGPAETAALKSIPSTVTHLSLDAGDLTVLSPLQGTDAILESITLRDVVTNGPDSLAVLLRFVVAYARSLTVLHISFRQDDRNTLHAVHKLCSFAQLRMLRTLRLGTKDAQQESHDFHTDFATLFNLVEQGRAECIDTEASLTVLELDLGHYTAKNWLRAAARAMRPGVTIEISLLRDRISLVPGRLPVPSRSRISEAWIDSASFPATTVLEATPLDTLSVTSRYVADQIVRDEEFSACVLSRVAASPKIRRLSFLCAATRRASAINIPTILGGPPDPEFLMQTLLSAASSQQGEPRQALARRSLHTLASVTVTGVRELHVTFDIIAGLSLDGTAQLLAPFSALESLEFCDPVKDSVEVTHTFGNGRSSVQDRTPPVSSEWVSEFSQLLHALARDRSLCPNLASVNLSVESRLTQGVGNCVGIILSALDEMGRYRREVDTEGVRLSVLRWMYRCAAPN